MPDRVSFICFSTELEPHDAGIQEALLGKRHARQWCPRLNPKRVKPFRSDLQGVAIEATPVDWDLGLEYHLRVDFHFRRPKSHLTSKGALTKAAPLFPTGRQIGDTDKLIRSVCDALTGICWYDDSQVVDITAKKRFASATKPSSPSHQSMSELTKALIQFHKDVDKIEKNARGTTDATRTWQRPQHRHSGAAQKRPCPDSRPFSKTAWSPPSVTSAVKDQQQLQALMSDGRNVTQEWGKAVTYQRRYAICAMLGLVADMDMDGAMLEVNQARTS